MLEHVVAPVASHDLPRHARGVRRSSRLPRHLRRRHPGERRAHLHRGAQREHAQRAEHPHSEPGVRRPAADPRVGPVHGDHLHAGRVAVRRPDVPAERVPALYVARRVCLHVDCPQSRPIRRHRSPAQPPQDVAGVPHDESRRRHLAALGPTRGARRCRLARRALPGRPARRHGRHLRAPAARLGRDVPALASHLQLRRLLRRAHAHHRRLLRADGAHPHRQLRQHAGRRERVDGGAGADGDTQQGRPARSLVRCRLRRVLAAAPRLRAVVPLRARRVQHVLARLQDLRLLPVVHQLMRQPVGALFPQPPVPAPLQQRPVLLLPTAPRHGRARRQLCRPAQDAADRDAQQIVGA